MTRCASDETTTGFGAFGAFDAAWSERHDRRRASRGGVRETYYAAGYQAGVNAENARLRERVAALEYLCERFGRLATDLTKAIPDGLRRHLTVEQLRALQEQGQQLMVERAAPADERGAK